MVSSSLRHQSIRFSQIATYVALGLWSIICILPVYWLALTSIKSAADLDQAPSYLPFIDFIPNLEAWRFILLDPGESLLPRFLNSLIISSTSAIVTLVMAVCSVYGMTRFKTSHIALSRYRTPIFFAVIALRLVPPVLVALPIYMIGTEFKIIDTHGLLIMIYSAFNFPLALLLVIPVLSLRVTVEEESARLDGAGHFVILTNILVPMNRVQLMTIGVLMFILCWNEYLFATYLTYDHAETLTPWMIGQLSMKEAQTGGGSEEISHMAAAAIFMAIPAFLLTYSLQRLVKDLVGRSLT